MAGQQTWEHIHTSHMEYTPPSYVLPPNPIPHTQPSSLLSTHPHTFPLSLYAYIPPPNPPLIHQPSSLPSYSYISPSILHTHTSLLSFSPTYTNLPPSFIHTQPFSHSSLSYTIFLLPSYSYTYLPFLILIHPSYNSSLIHQPSSLPSYSHIPPPNSPPHTPTFLLPSYAHSPPPILPSHTPTFLLPSYAHNPSPIPPSHTQSSSFLHTHTPTFLSSYSYIPPPIPPSYINPPPYLHTPTSLLRSFPPCIPTFLFFSYSYIPPLILPHIYQPSSFLHSHTSLTVIPPQACISSAHKYFTLIHLSPSYFLHTSLTHKNFYPSYILPLVHLSPHPSLSFHTYGVPSPSKIPPPIQGMSSLDTPSSLSASLFIPLLLYVPLSLTLVFHSFYRSFAACFVC